MKAAALAALVVAVLGCGSNPPPAPASGSGEKSAELTELPDSCTTAEDCELVDACCGCNAGGRKLAIRKDAVASFQASHEQRCADQMCPQFISHDPSCDAEAICGSRNHCRVAPHMQHQ
jgi:hypothetical protein